jgi:hypothetical protein
MRRPRLQWIDEIGQIYSAYDRRAPRRSRTPVYRVRILDYTAQRLTAEATMVMASSSSESAAERESAAGQPAHVRDFRRDGYAIVRRVFGSADIANLAAAFDRVWQDGLRHARSFRHANVFFRIAEDRRLGRVLRYMQWPSTTSPCWTGSARIPACCRSSNH